MMDDQILLLWKRVYPTHAVIDGETFETGTAITIGAVVSSFVALNWYQTRQLLQNDSQNGQTRNNVLSRGTLVTSGPIISEYTSGNS